MGDTVLLLRYNCPDESCDYAGLGWHDLQRHVRTTHHRKMCDLCVRNKKIFTHEQDLFTDKELEKHMRHGDDRPGAIDQTGFRGHPLCSFCGERFYDDDKLYEHCRNKHERCFLCDRQNPRTPHYYYNYEALEQHFKKDHFPCLDRECLEKKFIVFGSELDLKAHQLSDHGDSLSKDLRRDARIVDMSSFDYRRSYQQERREAGASARDGRGGGRGRDPNAEPPPVTSAQPLRRDELAFQRQMAIHSTGGSLAGRTFGGQVNPPSSSSSAAGPSRGPSQSSSAQPIPALERLSLGDGGSAPRTPEQQAQLVRHAAVIERASNLLANDPTKMETFRNNISMYNKGAMTPRNLIDAFLALFADSSSNAVGIVVREVADLFDDKAKTEALRKAWNDWRAINEDYPSLPGLDGMRGATTASTGWAAAVAATPSAASAATTLQQQLGHTTRVLRLKSATRRSSTSSTGTSAPASSTSAAPAASSSNLRPLRQVPEERTSSAFPALPTSRGPGSATPSAMAANHRSLWSVPASSRAAESQPTAPRPSLNSEESFPSLPAAPKPMTTIFGYGGGRGVRRDLVGSAPSVSAWGTGGASSAGAGHGESGDQEAAAVDGGAKGGKKGRQGKKQVLMQWG